MIVQLMHASPMLFCRNTFPVKLRSSIVECLFVCIPGSVMPEILPGVILIMGTLKISSPSVVSSSGSLAENFSPFLGNAGVSVTITFVSHNL